MSEKDPGIAGRGRNSHSNDAERSVVEQTGWHGPSLVDAV